jgi:mRNA interferase MazF
MGYANISVPIFKKGQSKFQKDSDILIDQIRAIDNKRLIKKIGTLPNSIRKVVKENISIILDLE